MENWKEICLMNAEAKRNLDKPNQNRLLECFTYTLPAFENLWIIQGIVLERAQKELKKGIALSNFKNEQVQAMKDMLTNDKFERLGYIIGIGGKDPSTWDEEMARKIL